MIKSVVSFVRKEMKVKGRSEHNGRGVWEMGVDVDKEELLRRGRECVGRWSKRGLVERVVDKGDELSVLFNRECVGNSYYRWLWIGGRSRGCMGVLFYIDGVEIG